MTVLLELLDPGEDFFFILRLVARMFHSRGRRNTWQGRWFKPIDKTPHGQFAAISTYRMNNESHND